MLEQIAEHLRRQTSFAFESTLSGVGYARQIPERRAIGYRVELFFLALPTADVAIGRVALRVRQGGHNIPESVIRRRFVSGMRNFVHLYKPLVNEWTLYDNSNVEPHVLDWGVNP